MANLNKISKFMCGLASSLKVFFRTPPTQAFQDYGLFNNCS